MYSSAYLDFNAQFEGIVVLVLLDLNDGHPVALRPHPVVAADVEPRRLPDPEGIIVAKNPLLRVLILDGSLEYVTLVLNETVKNPFRRLCGCLHKFL